MRPSIDHLTSGLTPYTAGIVSAVDIAPILDQISDNLVELKMTWESVTPPPECIFRAFRETPLETARIVLLAQDPYPDYGVADGLAFSAASGRQPASMRNIMQCLVHARLSLPCDTAVSLISWAHQGVLLLNTSLTTIVGKRDVHIQYWRHYTDHIIRALGRPDTNSLIFILLGMHAHDKRYLIDETHHSILSWGHPSPASAVNRTDNPRNFMYCTVFTEANRILIDRGDTPVDWQVRPVVVDLTPTPTDPTAALDEFPDIPLPWTDLDELSPLSPDIWAFCDGAAVNNQSPICRGSWAFYVTDGARSASGVGAIPHSGARDTNCRAELAAMYYAMYAVFHGILDGEYSREQSATIVSDSTYAINCVSRWYAEWARVGILHTKKNIDMVSAAHRLMVELSALIPVKFQHVRGHAREPADHDSHEWFLWAGNDRVDRACQAFL